jgi:hypothetical protein
MEAIKVMSRSSYKSTIAISYFDLATSLHYQISNNTGEKLFNHVLGYKDRTEERLGMWERLNVVADTYTKVVL